MYPFIDNIDKYPKYLHTTLNILQIRKSLESFEI